MPCKQRGNLRVLLSEEECPTTLASGVHPLNQVLRRRRSKTPFPPQGQIWRTYFPTVVICAMPEQTVREISSRRSVRRSCDDRLMICPHSRRKVTWCCRGGSRLLTMPVGSAARMVWRIPWTVRSPVSWLPQCKNEMFRSLASSHLNALLLEIMSLYAESPPRLRLSSTLSSLSLSSLASFVGSRLSEIFSSERVILSGS